jgi:hypothetical protein
LAGVVDGATNLTNALRQGLFADRHIRPKGIEHLFLGHDPAGVLHQIPQHFEALGPQVGWTGRSQQA